MSEEPLIARPSAHHDRHQRPRRRARGALARTAAGGRRRLHRRPGPGRRRLMALQTGVGLVHLIADNAAHGGGAEAGAAAANRARTEQPVANARQASGTRRESPSAEAMRVAITSADSAPSRGARSPPAHHLPAPPPMLHLAAPLYLLLLLLRAAARLAAPCAAAAPPCRTPTSRLFAGLPVGRSWLARHGGLALRLPSLRSWPSPWPAALARPAHPPRHRGHRPAHGPRRQRQHGRARLRLERRADHPARRRQARLPPVRRAAATLDGSPLRGPAGRPRRPGHVRHPAGGRLPADAQPRRPCCGCSTPRSRAACPASRRPTSATPSRSAWPGSAPPGRAARCSSC